MQGQRNSCSASLAVWRIEVEHVPFIEAEFVGSGRSNKCAGCGSIVDVGVGGWCTGGTMMPKAGSQTK
jgi:hypothetical protein